MPRQEIDCPICGTPMQKRSIQDGLEIDYCDWHGVWLDSGELEQLVHAFGAREAAPNRGGQPGVGKAIVQGLAGAAVMGEYWIQYFTLRDKVGKTVDDCKYRGY